MQAAASRNGAAALAVIAGLAGFALDGASGGSLIAWLLAALLGCAAVILTSNRHGVLVTSILAFGSNAYLFSRKLDAAAGPSACNVNEVLNCDLVNTSAASEMFGLPVTLYGMGLYMGLGIATLYRPKSTPRLYQVTSLFAVLSLIYSAYLGWEASKLGAFCVVCITIYLCNGLLLWAGLRGLPGEGRKLLDQIGAVFTSTSFLTITATFLVVVVVGAGRWNESQATLAGAAGAPAGGDPNDPTLLSSLYASPAGPITLDGTEPILGDPNAPYMVVEWADFACPHCARAAMEFEQLVQEYPVQVRFKAFPLSSACNPVLEVDTGTERCRAAHATECAHRQGRFYEYAHVVFMNQAYMSDKDLAYMAGQTGLDMDQFNACFADPSVMQEVQRDAAAGAQADVHGTPAIFLKGTHGDQFVEVLQGPAAVLRLIEAREAGVSLPPPGPPKDHGH